MSQSQSSLEIEYARAYGQHDFASVTGDIVSAISQPSWEEFLNTLHTARFLGNIVLSPELITSPEALEAIPGRRAVIEERVEQTRQLSAKLPNTLIVLGTATFNNSSGRPANSQLFIKNGETVAQNNKRSSFYPLEKQVFTMRQPGDRPRSASPNVVGMICSDILGETIAKPQLGLLTQGSDEPSPPSIVGPETDSVLLSSCWALPLESGLEIGQSISREDRFRWALEGQLSMLFRKHPALREVIVCDSLPPTSGVEAPYNARVTRQS